MPLLLRAMEPEDLQLLYDVENDTSTWDAATTNMPYSLDLLRQYILSTTGDIFADKQLRLIVETADGTTVGIVDLTSFDPKNRRAEVGIAIVSGYRRKGHATEALALLEAYSRQTAHIHTLYAIVPADNTASRRVFEKCGFEMKTVLDEWLYDGEKYKNALFMQKTI